MPEEYSGAPPEHKHSADDIDSGTLADARIPDLETLSYGGAFAQAQIPEIDPSNMETKVSNDILRHSNDAEKTTTSTSYVKLKEVSLAHGISDLRVKFDIKASGGTVYAKVYVNGSPVGTEKSRTSTSYGTQTEDLTNLSENDLIQIYVKHSTGAQTSYVENMRFYWDLGDAHTNQDP